MPCARKSAPPSFFASSSNTSMNSRPMVLRFVLRIGLAFQRVDEAVRRVDMDQREVVVLAEHGDDVGRLVLAHQAVVDEDAGQLVADRLVDQQGGDRGIDAARQAADDLPVADLLADRLDRLLAIGGHRPVALDAGDLVDEILQAASRRPACAPPPGGTDAVHLARLVGDRRRRARPRTCRRPRSPRAGEMTRSPWLIQT